MNAITATINFTATNNPTFLTLVAIGVALVAFFIINLTLADPDVDKKETAAAAAVITVVVTAIVVTLAFLVGQPRANDDNIAQLATTITQQTEVAPNIESLTNAISDAKDGSAQAFTATNSEGQVISGSLTFDAPVNTQNNSTAAVTVTLN